MTGVPVFGPMGGVPQQPNQQQQQPHPTVPYGQNGVPQAIVIPPNQPMPTAGQQQQMQQQAGGYQQQVPYQQQPQQNPQQQQYPASQQQGTFPPGTQPPFATQRPPQALQQQSNVFQIPDNAVLDGPTVPPELRGRTWGQIRGAYSTMAQEFFSQPGRIPAPRPNQIAAPQQQQQQQQVRPQQTQGQDREPSFWENPEAAINRAVERQLQPVVQQATAEGIRSAYENARANIQDFGVLEQDLMTVMKGAPDAATLADPGFWRSTADLVRGRMMAEGRYNPQQVQQQQVQQQGGYPQQNQFQQQQSQPQQQRGPGVFQPAGAFFTENPTPTPGMSFNGQQMVRELTPEQKSIAQKMGMTEQEYRDWSVGFQQNAPVRSW